MTSKTKKEKSGRNACRKFSKKILKNFQKPLDKFEKM
jgi:hypothetical protein